MTAKPPIRPKTLLALATVAVIAVSAAAVLLGAAAEVFLVFLFAIIGIVVFIIVAVPIWCMRQIKKKAYKGPILVISLSSAALLCSYLYNELRPAVNLHTDAETGYSGNVSAEAVDTAQNADTVLMAGSVQTADTSEVVDTAQNADTLPMASSVQTADTSWVGVDGGYKCRVSAAGRRECISAEYFKLVAKGKPKNGRDTWFRFHIEDGAWDHGFIDMRGKTRMELERSKTHSDYMWAEKFDDIIIYDEHYITKTGKRFGKDSVLWYLDGEGLIPNCESEGFIVFNVSERRNREFDPRFCEYDSKKFGMFNRNGDVVIPANYEILGKVVNGMVYARKNCIKINAFNGKECAGIYCNPEHCVWGGGTALLLDTMNNVLIENFGSTSYTDTQLLADTLRNIWINDFGWAVDFYSVKKTNTPHPDKIRTSFPAKNGGYYSFIAYEKEFIRWLTNDLLKNLTTEKLINTTSDVIHCGTEEDPYRHGDNKRQFIIDNFTSIKAALLEILNPKLKKRIYHEWYHGSFVYQRKLLLWEYLDNCGEYNFNRYPAIIIDIEKSADFLFLRAKDGYKLRTVCCINEQSTGKGAVESE